MPSRAGYQALSQYVDADDADAPEADVSGSGVAEADELLPAPVTAGPSRTRGRGRLSRQNAPRSIDLGKLDNAFKRWTESIAVKVNLKRKKKVEDGSRKEILRSVFEPVVVEEMVPPALVSARYLCRRCRVTAEYITDQDARPQPAHDTTRVGCVRLF
jgi:phosphatidylinositol 4-kinase type 2